MSAVETVARQRHEGSDHAADGAAFGSPTCNCLTVAGRIVPMLADAWGAGYGEPRECCGMCPKNACSWDNGGDGPTNPYETKGTTRG